VPKLNEIALKTSEPYFRSIFEASPIGKELYDADGKLLEVNKACLNIFGVIDPAELNGFSLFDDPNLAQHYKSKLQAGESVQYEVDFDFGKVKEHQLYRTSRSGTAHLNIIITPLTQCDQKTNGYLVQIQDGSVKKQAERPLIGERRRLANILEGTHVGTWEWNIQTGETIFNERWAEIIGYTLTEIAPVSIRTWQRFSHPDDYKKAERLLKSHFSGALDYFECEIRMLHKSGDWIWVIDRGRIGEWTDDGKPLVMAGTHQDITVRKRTETALRESEEKYRLLHENAGIGIGYYRLDGTVISYNKLAARHMNGQPEDFVGKSVYDLFPKSEADVYLARIKNAALANESVVYEDSVRLPLAKKHFISTFTKIVDSNDHIFGIQIISQDTTPQKEAGEQIRNALHEKETLLKEIHHRVKNNMQVITSLLKLQYDSTENESVKAILRESQSRVYAMSAVHETLYGSENLADIDLKSYLSKIAVAIQQTYADNRQISIRIAAPPIRLNLKQSVPLGLTINELLSNAFKYAFPDGRTGHIEMVLEENGPELQIMVRDDGVGLPEPLDWTNCRTLGLRLIRTLVENQLDGRLEVINDGGLKFTFKFTPKFDGRWKKPES